MGVEEMWLKLTTLTLETCMLKQRDLKTIENIL